MMQHLDKEHTLKGLRLAGIVLVALIAALFTSSFVSAKSVAVDTSTFCTKVTSYGGASHCQIGDKNPFGWLDKTGTSVPPVASMKVINLAGNPGRVGKLTIYTPQLYCASYWSDWVGRGYVEVNGQRFPTCLNFSDDLGPGGYNSGANYLYYKTSMVRIITNIRVVYGDTIKIRIYGRIYAAIRDDCRKATKTKCLYPGISPGWIFSYVKTGSHDTDLADFYRTHAAYGPKNTKKIRDFLTIKYADFDFDNHFYDYYDFDDLSMTFALAEY